MTTIASLKPCKPGKVHRWRVSNAAMVMPGKCVHCGQTREFSPYLDGDKTGWTEGTYAGSNRATWGSVAKVNEWYG